MSQNIIYVSPRGQDLNPGTRELPLRTITAARDRARTLKGPATVEVRAGIYGENLVFDARDSGHTYRTGEGAVITGGLRVPYDATESVSDEMRDRLSPGAAENVRAIDLKRYGVGKEAYEKLYAIGRYSTGRKYDGVVSGVNLEVFENGERMTLARYPGEGFLQFEEIADVGDAAEFPPQNYWKGWEERRNHRGGLYIIDKETNERVKTWKEQGEVWMAGCFYWDWADSSTPVTFDTENRGVYPGYVSRFGARKEGCYYFYNILQELASPGMYWIDRQRGILYVYPRGTQEAVFEISAADSPLICLSGAENMVFSGFTLTNVRQTAVTVKGNGNRFLNLHIRNTALHGIQIEGYQNTVENCEISHMGQGGIYLKGGVRDTLTPGENTARHNRIHDFSQVYRTYQAGVHLSGVGNICAHNEIWNTPHLAVSYEGNEHLIEYNYIHDAVLRSEDAGAVYAGFDWAAHGTVIRYNRIERVGSDGFPANGIYWDDGLSGQTAYGNLLIDIRGRGFLAGGGRDNVIRDNVILGDCLAPIYYDDRNREGFLKGGWAHAACDRPDAPHWKKLAEIPYTSEIWRKKYPSLAGVSTDFQNPQDPAFPINPANVVLEHNVVIHRDACLGEIAESLYEYNKIGVNYLFKSVEEAGFCRETLKFHSPPADFPEIPVEKIPGTAPPLSGCNADSPVWQPA